MDLAVQPVRPPVIDLVGRATEFVIAGDLPLHAGQAVDLRAPDGSLARFRVVGSRRGEWVLRLVE